MVYSQFKNKKINNKLLFSIYYYFILLLFVLLLLLLLFSFDIYFNMGFTVFKLYIGDTVLIARSKNSLHNVLDGYDSVLLFVISYGFLKNIF